MTIAPFRNGYAFLLSVLFIGAIAAAVSSASLLIGWMEMRDNRVLERSNRALLLAKHCADRGLMELFRDSAFAGGITITTADGTCSILLTGGSGNEDRTLCVDGTSGGATRKLEIVLSRLLPSIQVSSWREVDHIMLCAYPSSFTSVDSELPLSGESASSSTQESSASQTGSLSSSASPPPLSSEIPNPDCVGTDNVCTKNSDCNGFGADGCLIGVCMFDMCGDTCRCYMVTPDHCKCRQSGVVGKIGTCSQTDGSCLYATEYLQNDDQCGFPDSNPVS